MVACRYDTISGLDSERSNEICFKLSLSLDLHQARYRPSQALEENCLHNPLLIVAWRSPITGLRSRLFLESRATLSFAFGKGNLPK